MRFGLLAPSTKFVPHSMLRIDIVLVAAATSMSCPSHAIVPIVVGKVSFYFSLKKSKYPTPTLSRLSSNISVQVRKTYVCMPNLEDER